MSDLRKHLDTAKRDYQSMRYPGNLAADILGATDAIPISRGRSTTMRIVGWSATISAVAAAIVLWVTLRPATQTPTTPSKPVIAATTPIEAPITVAQTDETTEEDEVIEVQTVAEMGTVPAFPQDVSFAPSASDMSIPSTFTFPSMDMDFTQDSTETDRKES
jgi:hypothetical protein